MGSNQPLKMRTCTDIRRRRRGGDGEGEGEGEGGGGGAICYHFSQGRQTCQQMQYPWDGLG